VLLLVVEPLVEEELVEEELDEDVLGVEPPAPPSLDSITTLDPHAASPVKVIASATTAPRPLGRSDDVKSES